MYVYVQWWWANMDVDTWRWMCRVTWRDTGCEVRGKYHCHVCIQSRLLRAPKDLLLLSLSQLCLFTLSLSFSHSAFHLEPPPLKYFHFIKLHNFPFFHLHRFIFAIAMFTSWNNCLCTQKDSGTFFCWFFCFIFI